jgi:hypothetical protein
MENIKMFDFEYMTHLVYKEDEWLLQERFSKTHIFIETGNLHAFFPSQTG